MKKLVVFLKNGKTKEFEIEKVHIRQIEHDSPVMLDMFRKNDKYEMHVSSNLIPAIDFVDKIEIVEG